MYGSMKQPSLASLHEMWRGSEPDQGSKQTHRQLQSDFHGELPFGCYVTPGSQRVAMPSFQDKTQEH